MNYFMAEKIRAALAPGLKNLPLTQDSLMASAEWFEQRAHAPDLGSKARALCYARRDEALSLAVQLDNTERK